MDHAKKGWIYAMVGSFLVGSVSLYCLKKSWNQTNSRKAKANPENLGHLHIYVGTETGNSWKYAEILSEEAKKYNFTPHVVSLSDFQIQDFKRNDFCVIICSTQKDGNPPENSVQFLRWVTKVAKASNENLSHLSYCVFGLFKASDCSNTTARTVNEGLEKLGAHCLIRQGEAEENNIQEFLRWKDDLLQMLPKRVKESRRSKNSEFLEVAHQVALGMPSLEIKYKETSLKLINSSNSYLESFKVVKIKELKRDPENSALHVELETDENYHAGCHFGIFPENSEELVRELAALLGYDLELTFQFLPAKGKPHPFPTPLTVGDALVKYCDLTSLINKKCLKQLSGFASDQKEKEKLLFLSSLKGKDEFKRIIQEPMLNIVDILKMFPSVKLPPGVLVQILDPIKPRLYCVCSSNKPNPNRFQITVEVLRQRTSEGKTRTGLCSGYFESMHVTALFKRVRGFFEDSVFKVPSSPKPLFMVSYGCGVAPFRSLIQELQYLRSKGVLYPEVYIYFGSKSKAKEFVYKHDLESAIVPNEDPKEEFEHRPDKWGEGPHVITKLYTAFSRDQAQKIYVQDILFSQHDKIWESLYNREGYLFVCGPGGMVNGVNELIKNIAFEHIGEEASEFMEQLKEQGRCCFESWGK